MGSGHLVSYALFRVLLPLSLLAATVVRFNGFSLTYGLLLLVAPLLSSPSTYSMAGHTGRYLICVLVFSSLFLTAQVIFQATLLAKATPDEPYGSILEPCSFLETFLRQLGLQRVEQNDIGNIIRTVMPDIGMFLISLVVFAVCRKLIPRSPPPALSQESINSSVRARIVKNTNLLVNLVTEILLVLFLAASGIAHPSVISSVYFLLFLSVATWWACYRTLGKRFALLRIFLLFYSGSHLILLYLYQFPFFQAALPPDNFYAKLFGLTGIIQSEQGANCHKPWLLQFWNPLPWPLLVSPSVILILYFLLACETRRWCEQVKEADATSGNVQQQGSRLSPNSARSRGRRKASGTSERQSLVEDADDNTNYSSMADVDQTMGAPDEDADAHSEAEDVGPKQRGPLISVFYYIMNQSYVGTLIIMMAWSITYHSWLTFVLLLWACLIWMIPSKRRVCLMFSPLIVLYAVGLLILQFIWGLSVDLPEKTSSGYSFKEIGMFYWTYPCLPLAVQIAFTFMFWLTLRQHMRELHLKKQQEYTAGLALHRVDQDQTNPDPAREQLRSGDPTEDYDGETIKAMGRWVWHMLSKYWILVCSVLFLIMAIQEAVIYRIIYMFMFLYFVVTFQLLYRFWRLTLMVFWWVVIIYSMIVLCLIYTYQFEDFPGYWKNATGINDTILKDIGLEQFDTSTLFLKLLTPTAFLILIILQLHYFHQTFMKISNINRHIDFDPEEFAYRNQSMVITDVYEDIRGENAAVAEGAPGDGDNTDANFEPDVEETTAVESHSKPTEKKSSWKTRILSCIKAVWDTGYQLADHISGLLWRIAEVHVFKIVAFMIFLCCMQEVSAINVVFIVFLLVGIPIPQLHGLMSGLCDIWAGLAILAKMIFQLSIVDIDYWFTNCSSVKNIPENGSIPYPFNQTKIDNAAYFGLRKTTELDESLPYYLRYYIVVLTFLAVEAIIKAHQSQYYAPPEKRRPRPGIIFPNIKRPDADKGLVQCAKYFANYAFYKFGLQLCFIMTVIAMVVRLDVLSLVYGLILGILLPLKRRTCFILWPIYIMFLCIIILVQYLSALGLPVGLCWEYIWQVSNIMPRNLQIYLYLPSYLYAPDAFKLTADFFQLLFVCLQWRAFFSENKDVDDYGGGDNKDITAEVEANNEAIPVEDFLSCKDSYLDYIKSGIFLYMFWVTLIIVFIAGTSRISLFCMGYLVGTFFFLWFGQELLMTPLRKLVRLWGILLGYCYFVLMCKCALQLVGCVYLDALVPKFCWVVQLFSIICLKAGHYEMNPDTGGACNITDDESGLVWDTVCFIFLLFQLRVYKSHYFRHVVIELQVQNQLAARGAELINTKLIRHVEILKVQEEEVLNSIKRKMERIKLRQMRLQQKTSLIDSDDHYVVIRSGDYYLFEDDSDEDIESSMDMDTMNLGEGPSTSEGKVGPLELLNTAMTGGTKEALLKAKRKSMAGADVAEGEDEDAVEGPSSSKKDKAAGSPKKPKSPKTEGPPGDTSVEEAEDSVGDEEEEKKETLGQRIMNSLRLLWALIAGALDYVIGIMEEISADYRNTATILDSEKEAEKIRQREQQWGKRDDPEIAVTEDETGEEGPSLEVEVPAADSRGITLEVEPATRQLALRQASTPDCAKKDAEEEFKEGAPRIFQLFVATYDALISRSEWVCYFAMILNHLANASLLSLPYPVSVFLWAMLSVPRPTKTYWVTVITYTEAVVVVKYLFQFGFFPWNSIGVSSSDPFFPPRIIGMEKKEFYAAFDLILLFCLFIHRSVLKRFGLWKDAVDANADLAKAKERVDESREPSPMPSPLSSPVSEQPSLTFGKHGATNEVFEASSLEQSDQLVVSGESAKSDQDSKEGRKKKKKRSSEGLCAACFRPFTNFYQQMTNPKFNAAQDSYALMFLCDFINFFIIVFGYKSFGPAAAGGGEGATAVQSVIQDNKVPIPFLIMLLLQFVLIIIDRALYLRKNVVGKFLYQIFLIILIHAWMFFILPYITQRPITENVPAQLWYFVKCIYFGLSALQIRAGYPSRILGNFLTKRYNYINLFLYKGFLAIPFLLELRALMDWMWTDTTLALTSWLEMEDIYANIFQLKCWRRAEAAYPTPRGQLRKAAVKYGVGGLVLFILIFIIWFPLLIFSLADSVLYEQNLPIDCTVKVQLGGYQPIFMMSAQQQFLKPVPQGKYSEFVETYTREGNGAAIGFLDGYKATDLTLVELNGESTAVWGISPPSQDALINDLSSETTLINLYFTISFTRDPKAGMTTDTVSRQFKMPLSPKDPVTKKIREGLAAQMNRTGSQPVLITDLIPRYIQVRASEVPAPVDSLVTKGRKTVTSFQLSGNTGDEWWQLQDNSEPDPIIPKDPDNINILAFNDRVAPAGLSFFTGYGIMGLYLSVILVIGQFVRAATSGMLIMIQYNHLPNVDRIMGLCLDIYMVREASELRLEEELFAKLLFLYRSPETRVKWTRHPPTDKAKQD